jgi:hypothetical protein
MTVTLAAYRVDVSDRLLDDLQRRLQATRLPDDPGNDDWRYGVNARYLSQLLGYWRDEYDWRAAERRINALPNFRATIDGTPVHLLHVRGRGPAPLPLIVTHGWPWSFWDMHKIIGPLSDPAAHGGDPADAFDVVVPSLPGYGFSGPPPRSGVNFWETADLWHRLMTEGLGYARYAASGGDWGALIASQLGHRYAQSLYGVHLMHAMLLDQFGTDRPWDATARSWDTGGGNRAVDATPEQRSALLLSQAKFAAHYAVHVLDPQTLAYALNDSPAGLLAWLLERWRSWGDSCGDVERVYTREHMITTAMIYWASGTVGSSMRAYADAARRPWQPSHSRTPPVEAPTGITFLGGENPPGVTVEQRVNVFRAGPRARFFNLAYLNAHAQGGHFGYYENPHAVVHDLRAMFRPLRNG